MTLDRRQFAPATQRNRTFILGVLQRVLPPQGTVLEIASGTGEHAIFLSPALSPRYWLPSDPNPLALDSITAWREFSPTPTLLAPMKLDVRDGAWPATIPPTLPEPLTAIVNINMIHISPWACCQALMLGAGRCLPVGGVLYLYGPFWRTDHEPEPSNLAFDEHLQEQDPAWGIRNLEAVVQTAAEQGLGLYHVEEMPAHNLSVVFRKEGS